MTAIEMQYGNLEWKITSHDDFPRLAPHCPDNEQIAGIAACLNRLKVCNTADIDWQVVCSQCESDPTTYVDTSWNDFYLTGWGTHPHESARAIIELYVAFPPEKSWYIPANDFSRFLSQYCESFASRSPVFVTLSMLKLSESEQLAWWESDAAWCEANDKP